MNRCAASLLGLGQGDGLIAGRGDVDQRIAVSAAGTEEEASVLVNLGLNRPEHDAKSAGATSPHVSDGTAGAADRGRGEAA